MTTEQRVHHLATEFEAKRITAEEVPVYDRDNVQAVLLERSLRRRGIDPLSPVLRYPPST